SKHLRPDLNSDLCSIPPLQMHGEKQYLQQIVHTIQYGSKKKDPSGTGTLSACYNLRGEFPLLTTKHVFWKGVGEELLWFIRDKEGRE
uniref:Thymidylate synthase n=1 Tax=Monodelphis domestica TaxID=13616 RepID=A0A5F8HA40_MONDO